MSIVPRSRMLLACILTVLAASFAFTSVASAKNFNKPQKYYLALGDSLAFGFQGFKVVPPFAPTQFTTGYVDDFARQLLTAKDEIRTVNDGCPGATTTTLLSVAGCTTYPFPLHHSYATTQIADAVAFLNANPDKVSPITLNIGANDTLAAVTACGGLANIPCIIGAVPGLQTSIGGGVASAVGQLRAAAPNAKILVVGLYNPYEAIGFTLGNNLSAAINGAIAAGAASGGATFVDPLSTFNVGQPQPATICALTLMCNFGDIHASDAGYQKIADLLWTASGYTADN